MGRIVLTSASYTARSLIASAQRSVNLFPEANPADASAPMTFYGTPGRLLWGELPAGGAIRLLYKASNGDLYAVCGYSLYLLDANCGFTLLASLSTGSGPVYAADNGISAVFVDGSMTAPTVNLSTHAAGLMSGDGWLGAQYVTELAGFLIFNRPGTGQFYWTGSYSLDLDPLDFATAESFPDNLVRPFADHTELWLFGETSTEVWGLSGDPLSPFARIGGAVMEVGCAAGASVAKLDNSIVWVGSDERGTPMVYKVQGYSPQRISTHAMEEEFRTYARLDDATSWSYQDGGHTFCMLSFPTANRTWCFDAASGLWHERAYRNADNVLERDRSGCHVYYQGMHLVGDREFSRIYRLDLDTYTDEGQEIVRIKSFQHMTANNLRQFFTKLTLDMQAGVATDSEPDPQVFLRWSDDGGYTWSNLISASLGQVGQYKTNPNFNRLGVGRDRVFEVSTSANAKIVLQGAFLEAKAGTA